MNSKRNQNNLIAGNKTASRPIIKTAGIMAYILLPDIKTIMLWLNFEKYTQEANDFIKQLAFALGTPENTMHASRVIEAFFHTLRERITPEESMHFVSQLPMYLKAVYINEWKIGSSLKKYKTKEEFLDSLRTHTNHTAAVDFATDEEAEKNLAAIVAVLRRYVTEGEMNHIMAQLPFDLVTVR